MSLTTLSDLYEQAKRTGQSLWRVVLLDDVQERDVTEAASFETMRSMYRAMRDADAAYDGSLRSVSGLAGGDGAILERFRGEDNDLISDFMRNVMAKAVKMGESNACMRRIVAAPTAGSCGVIPAVLLSYEEQTHAPEDRLVEALFIAAGFGEVIAKNAGIAGAEGGCQAEMGTASAMAAGALAYLRGADEEAILHAAAMAIKNMLGLTCDPVAGLVEVPCIKRNISGAVNAVVCAEMARAGLRSRIPPDEVVGAMQRIGCMIPASLRETGQDGLAVTPTGLRVRASLK